MNISLNSAIGIKNPIIMKLVGIEEIIMMVDPEATNNFISTLVDQKLRIPSEECKRWSCLKKW